MKFSTVRKKERQIQKDLEKILKNLSRLNPSATFEKSSDEVIVTDLKKDELKGIKIPDNFRIIGNADNTSSCYGFIAICSNSGIYTKYTIRSNFLC